jgi:hypothetical protein
MVQTLSLAGRSLPDRNEPTLGEKVRFLSDPAAYSIVYGEVITCETHMSTRSHINKLQFDGVLHDALRAQWDIRQEIGLEVRRSRVTPPKIHSLSRL